MVRVGTAFVILLFLSPYLALLPWVEWVGRSDWSAFQGSLIQSGLSALFSLFWGLLGSFGLLAVKRRGGIEWLVLLPTLLPTLFVIVAVLNVVQPFPFGLAGIVFFHTVINAGFVAVLLARLFERKFAHCSLLAEAEGASRWSFFWTAVVRGAWRECLMIGFTVFVFCMSSFAIPFVASAGNWATIEVAIYQAIKTEGDIGYGLSLAVQQALLIFFLSFFLRNPEGPQRSGRDLRLLPHPSFLFFGLTPVCLCILGFIYQIPFQRVAAIVSEIPIDSVLGSLFIGLSVGWVTFAFVMVFIPLLENPSLHRFFSGYTAPSTGIAAVGLLMLLPVSLSAELPRLVFALFLISFPSLYRSYLGAQRPVLLSAKKKAHLVSSSALRNWLWIEIPIVCRGAGFVSGLAAVWAMGDFAFSRFLMTDSSHLAMVVDSMVERYRVADGVVVIWLLLFLSLLVFLIFAGLGHVFSKKPALRI